MKTVKIHRAFTMLELVFVIIVVGIISALAIPRFDRDNLREAADQLISHIRYTQHLAMQDNRFDLSDATWYKTRWQLVFGTSANTNNKVAYSIFSDTAGTHTGQADISEIAADPQNPAQLLSGGYAGTLPYTDSRANIKLNLGETYGIDTVTLNGGCANSRISFDNLGRPMTGNPSSMTSPYMAARLIQTLCTITMTSAAGSIVIEIMPETGYTYIQ